MSPRIFLIILLGLFLSACTASSSNVGKTDLLRNPLMAEAIADRMIDYVTLLQIRANERKEPIQDPQVLRTMDDTFLESRRVLAEAHEKQDQGKRGVFKPVGDNYAKGEVLLLEGSLYFGYDFDVDAAPGMHVYLVEHVGPQTIEELTSEPTRDLGPIQNIIGPQEYAVGILSEEAWERFRTVALFSPSLKRVVAYAQIRKKGATEEGM